MWHLSALVVVILAMGTSAQLLSLPELNEGNLAEILKKNLPVGKLLLDIQALGEEKTFRLTQRLISPSSMYASTISFVIVNLNEPLWAEEPGRFGIEGRKAVFVIESLPMKFVLRSKPTSANIMQFCKNFTLGNLEPYFRSSDIPEGNALDADGIKVVVSKTFEPFMMDPRKHSVIYFHTPECPQCALLASIFARMAQSLPPALFSFGKMDLSTDDVPMPFMFPYRSFPTIYLTAIKRKQAPALYDGELDAEALELWIRQHVDQPGHIGLSLEEALKLRDAEVLAAKQAKAAKPQAKRPMTTQAQSVTKEPVTHPDVDTAADTLAEAERQARLQAILDKHKPKVVEEHPSIKPEAPCKKAQDIATIMELEMQAIRLRLIKLESLMQDLTNAVCHPSEKTDMPQS